MMRLRRMAGGFVVAYAFSWIAAFTCVKVLGLAQAASVVITVLAALAGGWAGWLQTESLVEWSARERRDAVIGWSVVIAIVGAVLSGLVPMPWTVLAALTWVIIVAVVSRALLTSPAERSPEAPV